MLKTKQLLIKRMIVMFGIVFTLVCLSPKIVTWAASKSEPNVGVSTTKETPLNIRASASTSSTNVSSLNPNAPIQVIGSSGDFYKVIYSTSGNVGYAHKSYINISSTQYGTVVTNGGTLNLRSSASTSSQILGNIPNQTVLPIMSTENGWYKVVWGKTVGYVSSNYFKPVTSIENSAPDSSSSTSPTRNEIIEYAKTFLGVYYQWGGNYPQGSSYGLDCSHFTYQVFKKFGLMNSYMVSADQANYVKKIARSELKPGDLVFFKSKSSGNVVHVAIYIGDGQIIGANGGDSSVNSIETAKKKNAKVKIQSIDYDSREKIYGRIPGL
ncbi:C40 family peptidase [Lachnoclostridium sp.]|uniref:C40 family peptidase n=1 Tax=Lachnoclostridium sp. TaxID=2028282 RepID=UPI00289ECEAB|nr:C40 family peptidase [Lachnoclostridium sp.]